MFEYLYILPVRLRIHGPEKKLKMAFINGTRQNTRLLQLNGTVETALCLNVFERHLAQVDILFTSAFIDLEKMTKKFNYYENMTI